VLFDLSDGGVYQCEKTFDIDNATIDNYLESSIEDCMLSRRSCTQNCTIADECDGCEYWDWCQGSCSLKRTDGLSHACELTKHILGHIKYNLGEDYFKYLNDKHIVDKKVVDTNREALMKETLLAQVAKEEAIIVKHDIRLQVNLKSVCNLRCSYCALSETSKNGYDEDISSLIPNTHKLIAKCRAENYDIVYFGLFGGEPTIVDPKVVAEVLNIIHNEFPKAKITIQTNGTLVNESYMSVLEDTLNETNNVSIGFSMDACKSMHDQYRHNSYDAALENLLRINRAGKTEVFTVPTIGPQHKAVQDEMDDWVAFMREENIPIFLAYLGGDEGIPNPNFYNWFTDWIIKNNLIHNAVKLFGVNWCYRNDCNKMLLDLSDGDIFQCENTFAKEFPISNWLEKPLSEVYTERQCHVDSVPTHIDCDDCEYQTFCNKGCPLYRIHGKPSDCEAIKKVFGHLGDNGIDWKEYIGLNTGDGIWRNK